MHIIPDSMIKTSYSHFFSSYIISTIIEFDSYKTIQLFISWSFEFVYYFYLLYISLYIFLFSPYQINKKVPFLFFFYNYMLYCGYTCRIECTLRLPPMLCNENKQPEYLYRKKNTILITALNFKISQIYFHKHWNKHYYRIYSLIIKLNKKLI